MSALAAVKPSDTTVVTLSGLARETLAQCNGDHADARRKLLSRLLTDRKLLATVLEPIIASALHDKLGSLQGNARHHITKSQGKNAVAALADGIARSLMDFPLAGGLRLRDASREQVAAQAQIYQDNADTMGHRARWLALVAQSLPDGKTVGSTMSEERLAELFEQGRSGL